MDQPTAPRAARFPAHPLYFVTDGRLTGGRPQSEVVAAALAGGVRLVQYRDKEKGDAEFLREGREILRLCRDAGAILMVNDRVELAKELGADGVHLGQGDLGPGEARRLLGPGPLIALSTHNRDELLQALSQPVDCVNIGPMFPTATKDHSAHPALGIDRVFELAALCPLPWTTMGGIKRHHLPDLFRRGARTVAMVTEISLAPDVTGRVRELLAAIAAARTA